MIDILTTWGQQNKQIHSTDVIQYKAGLSKLAKYDIIGQINTEVQTIQISILLTASPL